MRAQTASRSAARTSNPAWPFTVPLVGLPIWWLLGLWQIMFFVAAVPMVVFLLRRRTIAVPRGFGMWLLWLAWLLTGLLVMQVDAPGTVAGVNINRYLSFGFRFGWYLIATIAALYVINTRHILDSRVIVRSVAWFFVALVGGGVLGTLAPSIDFPSVLQLLLPDGVASNSVVNELTRVQSAQVQDFLGAPQARPSAPFIYTNEWGFATAISLPFFVAAWWTRGGAWRWAMAGVLMVALATIVASLNRGTWLAVLAAVALALLQSALRGNLKVLSAAVIVAVLGSALILFSPLGDLISARLANGHSDNVRGDLAGTAIRTAAEGSPALGFGTTRYVLGTFTSIAGGATDACPSCEPPPLGTHGQLWLVAFGAGFVGVALFVGFILAQLLHHIRARTAYAMAATSSLLLLLVTLPIYNSVGIPLYLGLIGVGLLAREATDPLPQLQDLLQPVLRHRLMVIACCVLGATVGFAYNAYVGAPVAATQRVLVPSSPLTAVPGVRSSTLDSEATIATSAPVVMSVATALDISPDEARRGLRITAEPNTRVLLLSFVAGDGGRATAGVQAAVKAFLAERSAILADLADDVSGRYQLLQEELDAVYAQTRPMALAARRGHLWDTLGETTRRWTHAEEVLDQFGDVPQAQMISGVVTSTDDTPTIRVASGFALGLLCGLVGAWAYDQRLLRIGGARGRLRSAVGVPVAFNRITDAAAAARAVSEYSPVAGVVADPASPPALALAEDLDNALDAVVQSGRRTLILASPSSRVGRVRRLVRESTAAGLEPVGLIICRPAGRGRKADTGGRAL